MKPTSVLIIQTAFIGDVILATGLIEKIKESFPESSVDFLLRKGNESLLQNHPKLREVLIWDKKNGKIKNLLRLAGVVRKRKYDWVVNIHRFGSSGLITALSGAHITVGFNKNPFSFFFRHSVRHEISKVHEVERNFLLIQQWVSGDAAKPALYPTSMDEKEIEPYIHRSFVCVAPTSVWFTKQFPASKWVEFLNQIHDELVVYLLGASGDMASCEEIKNNCGNKNVINLAGKLSFLQSAALMKRARMNFVNDSAPMHLASSVNAPVTAIYCSTVPTFGFGPLSNKSFIVETKEILPCRPCGLHGFRQCPKGHFNCAHSIQTQQLLQTLSQ